MTDRAERTREQDPRSVPWPLADETDVVAGAQSLPLSQLPARTQEVPKDQTVYLVCQGGGRSGQAAELLGEAGYDVRSVAGGTKAWIESGGETASGLD